MKMHKYTDTCAHIHRHTCIHVHTYMHMHTHVHTHTKHSLKH